MLGCRRWIWNKTCCAWLDRCCAIGLALVSTSTAGKRHKFEIQLQTIPFARPNDQQWNVYGGYRSSLLSSHLAFGSTSLLQHNAMKKKIASKACYILMVTNDHRRNDALLPHPIAQTIQFVLLRWFASQLTCQKNSPIPNLEFFTSK
jgi:hypothetical protein